MLGCCSPARLWSELPWAPFELLGIRIVFLLTTTIFMRLSDRNYAMRKRLWGIGAVARTMLGIWSFFVPMLADAGIRPVAALLMMFLALSGGIGFWFMADTPGKILEQIEAERGS
jgi:hypothetical protein